MSAGIPDRIENSMLYVCFDSKDDIITFQLLSKSKEAIRNRLKKLTGDESAELEFQLKEGLHAAAVQKRSLEELKRDVGKNPMVRETADLFSGTIVDVLE